MTWEKLEVYSASVTRQFEVLCSAHADLCAEIESRKMACEGLNSPELQEEVLEELLMEYTDKVTEQSARAETRIEIMKAESSEVFQDVGENRLGRGSLLSRGSQGGFKEAGFTGDLQQLNLSGNSGQNPAKVESRKKLQGRKLQGKKLQSKILRGKKPLGKKLQGRKCHGRNQK